MTQEHQFESLYARNHLPATEPFRNLLVAESASFVALPTIGPLVEGWTLIVPRRPALSMGHLNEQQRDELTEFSVQVAEMVSGVYGPVALFEHGPAQQRAQVGCGVDYAHLHVVPTEYNLRDSVDLIFPSLDWHEITGFANLGGLQQSGRPYLFLSQRQFNCRDLVATSSLDIPSQLFRKAIAQSIGVPSEYDWKSFPRTEVMRATYENLLSLSVS